MSVGLIEREKTELRPYFKGFILNERIRAQPWSTAERDENEKYYDFRAHPELISEVLEDFRPWDHYESVERFYELVRWVNGDDSRFESNDCAFAGPSENAQKEKFSKELVCSGRLMLYFRSLDLNLSTGSGEFALRVEKDPPDYLANLLFEWLVERSLELIGPLDKESIWTCLALEIHPAFYTEALVNDKDKFGHQVSFQFWAWGDNEGETMENFGIVVDAMSRCLRILSDEMPEALRTLQLRHASSAVETGERQD
jgi:hypothetical protein